MASLFLAAKEENKQSHVRRRWQAQAERGVRLIPAVCEWLRALPVLPKHSSRPTTLHKISGSLVSPGLLQASPKITLLLQNLRINPHFSTAEEHSA